MLKYISKDDVLSINLNENLLHPNSKIKVWWVTIKWRPFTDRNGFTSTNDTIEHFDTKKEAEGFINELLKVK